MILVILGLERDSSFATLTSTNGCFLPLVKMMLKYSLHLCGFEKTLEILEKTHTFLLAPQSWQWALLLSRICFRALHFVVRKHWKSSRNDHIFDGSLTIRWAIFHITSKTWLPHLLDRCQFSFKIGTPPAVVFDTFYNKCILCSPSNLITCRLYHGFWKPFFIRAFWLL